MASDSVTVSRSRPFYAEYAAAYDLLIVDPVEPWAEAVHRCLTSSGAQTGTVLDAGCGTGRHAAALVARGHQVDLADGSPDLLAQATQRNPSARAFEIDLVHMRVEPVYQAVVSRGVLNDMITDEDRDAVLTSFAAALRPNGVVVLDVRDADGSRQRADGVSRSRTVDLGIEGRLTFTSATTWRDGKLHVAEQYLLTPPDAPSQQSEFAFIMRPWSADELLSRMGNAGFRNITIAPGAGRLSGDRFFVTANR